MRQPVTSAILTALHVRRCSHPMTKGLWNAACARSPGGGTGERARLGWLFDHGAAVEWSAKQGPGCRHRHRRHPLGDHPWRADRPVRPVQGTRLGVVHGNQIWINETNAEGRICGRQIKLTVSDHGHDVGKAQAHYPALEPNVLGFMQIMGSQVNAALSQKLVYNETTAVALSQSSELLANPYMIIPGTTYDVEMINGLSYLMETGRLRDGDTIGHIWIDDEYGANGLRGTRYFAEKHRLTVRDARSPPPTRICATPWLVSPEILG